MSKKVSPRQKARGRNFDKNVIVENQYATDKRTKRLRDKAWRFDNNER